MPQRSHRRPDHRGKTASLPESWPHKIQDESGSIDPGFPRHNYANDLPPPASWFPPFFTIPSQVRLITNSTALGLFPPCTAYYLRSNSTPRSSHSSACKVVFIPSCRQFVCSLFLCALGPSARVRIRYLSHRLTVHKVRGGGFFFLVLERGPGLPSRGTIAVLRLLPHSNQTVL
jgi:hypothetical protein